MIGKLRAIGISDFYPDRRHRFLGKYPSNGKPGGDTCSELAGRNKEVDG